MRIWPVKARCVGLLDSVLRDLGPLKYQVSDPRYQRLLTASMAIFDRQGSAGVPLETRIAAADALGQAGDPRIDFRRDDYWVTVPAGRFLMGAQSKDPGSRTTTRKLLIIASSGPRSVFGCLPHRPVSRNRRPVPAFRRG